MYSTSPREESHGGHLDLSLGMSVHGTEDAKHKNQACSSPTEKSLMHRNHVVGGLGSQRTWFVQPWSLPAAASGTPPQPEIMMRGGSPVVGWPPVRASRKNLSGTRLSAKPSMEAEEKEAKKSKKVIVAASPVATAAATTTTMFVKVNMEGLAVGRKIDLMAHDGYSSLSNTIRKLFDSFLSAGKKMSIDGADDERDDKNGDHAKISGSLELLYEDNEGDKLLVGDVPWEMFVGSVKRLYITYRRKTHRR